MPWRRGAARAQESWMVDASCGLRFRPRRPDRGAASAELGRTRPVSGTIGLPQNASTQLAWRARRLTSRRLWVGSTRWTPRVTVRFPARSRDAERRLRLALDVSFHRSPFERPSARDFKSVSSRHSRRKRAGSRNIAIPHATNGSTGRAARVARCQAAYLRPGALGGSALLTRAVENLAETASAWPEKEPGIRARVLDKYPYTLLYRVAADEVLIAAVAHQKRKPRYWRQRTP